MCHKLRMCNWVVGFCNRHTYLYMYIHTYVSCCSEEQPPGSAVAVARNLLKSVATQFADRRLFIFLFNHQYLSERVVEQVFTALGGSLPPPSISGEGDVDVNEGDSEEMTVVSPLTYFLQVCCHGYSVS